MNAVNVFLLIVFTTTSTGQEDNIGLQMKELNLSGVVDINATSEVRYIPLPAGSSYVFTCTSSDTFASNPWVFLNSSGEYEPVEVAVESSMLPIFTHGNSAGWKLRVTNFTTDREGMYECKQGGLSQTIFLIEGNPGVVMQSSVTILNREDQSDVGLDFLVTGNPKPVPTSYIWYFNDQELTEDYRDELDISFLLSGRLAFNSLSFKNEGKYTLSVQNEHGNANSSYMAYVIGIPELMITEPSDPIYIGQSFKLVCNASNGNPDSEFSWRFGNEDISESDDYSITNYQTSSILVVENAGITDAGKYRCVATNLAGQTSYRATINVYLPPLPIPTIGIPSQPIYAGSSISLYCSTSLSNPLHQDKNITTVWYKNDQSIDPTSDDRFMIISTIDNTLNMYTSKLTVFPTCSSIDSGNYSCSVTVYNDSITSETVTSDDQQLIITVPEIDVLITPHEHTIIDTAPFNTVMLNCTTNKPTDVTVSSRYEWLIDDSLISEIGSILLIHEDKYSVLTDAPTVSGMRRYTCRHVVNLFNTTLSINSTVAVNVRGPSSPNAPINQNVQRISHNSVQISFTIPSISYTPEQYYIQYGQSSRDLTQQSKIIQGSTDLTEENRVYQVILEYLNPNTVFYYIIVSNNSHSVTSTDTGTFQTPRVALIEIKMGPFSGCLNGKVLDPTNIQNFYNEFISERISEQCDCSFPQTNLANGTLHCTDPNSYSIIYRVYIIPTIELNSGDIVNYLNESIWAEPTVVSGISRLSIDTSCSMMLSSIDDPLCEGEIRPTVGPNTDDCSCKNAIDFSSSTVILVIVIAAVFVVLIITVLIIMGCLCVYQQRRLKGMNIRRASNQYSVVSCKRETSFIDHHKKSPPTMAPPSVPSTTNKWDGDVAVSECPAYLYNVKPLDEDMPQHTMIERQPTPGIYDSIDGLNNAHSFNTPSQIRQANPTALIITDNDDYTGSSTDYS